MTDRFPLLRVAVMALVVCALPGTASAATATVTVPPDAPTVATTPAGGAVIAWMNGAKLCTAFQDARAARPTSLVVGEPYGRTGQASCDAPPVLSQLGARSLNFGPPGERSYLLWGVAGPAVGRMEARAGGVVTAASAATAAPLPGAAAELRFWALEVPSTPAADEFALLDDAGVVRRALRPGERIGFDTDDQPLDGDTILQHGRSGDTTWRLRRTVKQILAPTPLEPERREDQRCLSFATKSSDGGGGGFGSFCDHEVLDTAPIVARADSDCDLGAYVTAMVRTPVRTVVAVLGDGTRQTVPLKALGGFYPGARAGVLMVGHGMAIRRVLALGRSGRTIQTLTLEAPPLAESPCDQDSGPYIGFEPGPATPLRSGSHVPHVVDRDARICVAIDRAPRSPEDCVLPPVDPQEALVRTPAVAGGAQYLYMIVPAEVAQVRVTLDDRTTRTIAAAPVTGYAGRYAPFLRQIALNVPAGQNVTNPRLLDARGRVFDVGFPDFNPVNVPRLGRAFTLVPAVRGVGPLSAMSIGFVGAPLTCLSFRSLAGLDHCDFAMEAKAEIGDSSLQVRALCAPRRLAILAALPHRDDRVSIRLRSGRTIRARTIRLPGRAGAAAGRSVAFAVLGPLERPDEIRLRGRSGRRLLVTLPAASAQCGYTAELSFDDGAAA